MNKREVRIDSYFSLETDLAAEMQSWPEFVNGEGYNVTLKSDTEEVSTTLEHNEDQPIVVVRGRGDGQLFNSVLGATLFAMAGNSDDLWTRVMRWRET
ncbi:MAG: hypothetical protein P4L91_04200 [Burkholderiaceae bacterium]|nr:hypothetical protein [Burkholderiaceae bacterium]